MGVEEFHYKDKRVGKDVNDKGSLQNLVNQEFKKIDRRGYRDDQEIRNAGWNTITKIINDIKKDKTMVYGPDALKPLTQLSSDLVKEYNNMKGCKLFTNNADKINQVANRIDNAENEALQRLKRNRTVQDSRDMAAKVEKDKTGMPMFVTEKSKDGKDTGNLVFTKASNPVRIDQALKGLFSNPNQVYQIDYTNCDTSTPKGKAIKEKMTRLIGTKTCYLRYDSDQKTYTIRDSNGNGVSDRAYIWEGVKLIPDGMRQWQAYNQVKQANNQIGNFDDKWVENQVNLFLKDVPSAKKLTEQQIKTLISKTESRVNELLKKAKSLGYELESEPITKKWFGKGHMELHLNSGSSEVDRTFWENMSQIGSDLSKFIDENEGEYAKYLTKRVQSKWNQMDKLTKTENVNVASDNNDQTDKIVDQAEKIKMLEGIGYLETMVDNFKETEGDSWMDNDDRRLIQMKKILRNGKTSLENSNDRGKKAIINTIITPFRREWAGFKRITQYITTQDGNRYENPNRKAQKQYLNDVFFGTKAQQYTAIREMGGLNRLFDKTETSFLAEEMENGIGEGGLETNNTNINRYITSIESQCKFTDTEFDNVENNKVKTDFIDGMYKSAESGNTDNFIKYFVTNHMFPSNWEKYGRSVKKLVKEKFEQLMKKFQQNKEQIEKLSLKDEAKKQHEDRLVLEQKENKTEEDLIQLQALIYLEEHPDKQKEINQKTLDVMKKELMYGNVDKMVKGTLFPVFAEMGGGAKGTGADIYNDIKGIGAFNLSDDNAKLVGEIVAEIAITVAVAIVTAGAGAAVMQGILRGAAMVAKAGKMFSLVNKIDKIARIVRLGQKGFKVANWAGKTAYLAINAGGLLIEGTIFNAASNMIHSAVHGTSLDTLNLNPIAKENIQTAAFLGALSVVNKIGGKIIMKIGGRTKINVDWSKGLEYAAKQHPGVWTASLVSELGGMLAAEQGMNFIFGHDIVDPETGEVVTSHSLTCPTQEEWIQMIGMLLAFKAVKPGLWQRYAQRLNDGTLEICRGVKKNEVLIRDPQTGRVERVQDLIDGKDKNNTNKSTSEQRQRQSEPERQRESDRQERERHDGQHESENISEEERRRAEDKLYEKFDKEIMSENGITIDGITYKLKREPYEGQNLQHKGRVVYTETGPDGRVKYRVEANSNTFSLPENSNGNRIRDRFNSARKKYIDQNLDATIRSNRQEFIRELSGQIESKTIDLEQKRQNKANLERRKKVLSDEINGLKSRKVNLEEQLKRIPKEVTVQPETVSLNDIYKVFFDGAGEVVSIGGKKCKFIKVEGNKIVFDNCEFRSFKELKEAGIKFDIDIKVQQQRNRLEKTYEKQQKLFEELVEAEARISKSNEIIRKYEELQQQKAQIESELNTNKFFADHAQELVGKHIWIDGVEYQCTGKKINNGRTTLEFKQSDGNEHFTISSFEQLKNRGQVNGYGDRYDVIDKSTRAAGRELSRAERENHELLWGENGNPDKTGLFKGEAKSISDRRQQVQQIDQQLQSGKSDYDNAKLATNPKKVPNPEYQRLQDEIEGVNNQLVGKERDLNALNQELGTAENEISALEREISGLRSRKDNLSGNQEAERQRQAEQERQRQAEQERQRQAEQERQRQAEQERQRQAEQERQRQAEQERQRQAELERQRQAELERQRQAELERQRQAELERQRQAELERQGNERPERGINTERREMSEVQRNSDVVAIGDLHGEYIALKGNMEFAGLAREVNGHLEWTGGNKKVVFQGDILADRGTDGLRIIKEIHNLREQARKQGGDIDIIVGNHDDFMIAYLLGGKVSRFARPGQTSSGLDIAMINGQGQGLTELLDFIGIKRTGEYRDFFQLGDKNHDILNAMRNSPEGKLILEEICNMKLVSQVDDVLYCHTNPTARMLQYLTNGNIQGNIKLLNQKYQGYLREKLLGEGSGNISLDAFNNISDIFLNTGNRNISGVETYMGALKSSGINMISHGHSGGSPYRSTEIGGVKIVDTDYTYGKYGELDHEHSVSIVKKENGSVEMGEGNEWKKEYIGKKIEFHLRDRRSYSGIITDVQGQGTYRSVIIKYNDPNSGNEKYIPLRLSHSEDWGGYKIAA